jgi:spore germination protein
MPTRPNCEHGWEIDALLFISYDWGYSYGPPASVTPVNLLKESFKIFINQVSPQKLQIGLPIIGYDWELPYIPSVTRANAITTTTAIEIAASAEATIRYNEITEAPYFFYNKNIGELHIVWFKDARSIDAISGFVAELDLQGLAIWNSMHFFTQMWFIINNKYEIEKVYGDNMTPDNIMI